MNFFGPIIIFICIQMSLIHADQKDENFLQCCKSNGMGNCAERMCRYNLNRNTETECTMLKCYQHLPTFMRCAGDERPVEGCYERIPGLDEFCTRTLGAARVPTLESIFLFGPKYLPCFKHISEILRCHKDAMPQEGHTQVCTDDCPSVAPPTLRGARSLRYYRIFTKLMQNSCRDSVNLEQG